MSKRIFRKYDEPDRPGLTYQERFQGEDKGLITCWEVGRKMKMDQPDLAECAMRGELPPMDWKGGVEKPLKNTTNKIGTLFYLAQWQGLRGEDLDIDLGSEPELTCSKTGVKVVCTGDYKKYANDGIKETTTSKKSQVELWNPKG